MGQYANPNGGMYLVESPDDVATLQVKDPDNLHYMSQTTLSVDDTADVIDALRAKFPNIQGPRKDEPATAQIQIVCASCRKKWAPRPI